MERIESSSPDKLQFSHYLGKHSLIKKLISVLKKARSETVN